MAVSQPTSPPPQTTICSTFVAIFPNNTSSALTTFSLSIPLIAGTSGLAPVAKIIASGFSCSIISFVTKVFKCTFTCRSSKFFLNTDINVVNSPLPIG